MKKTKAKKSATAKKGKAQPKSAKDKSWYKEYLGTLNERRREKYAGDKAYRAKSLQAARDSYRENNAVQQKDCRDNIAALGSIGKNRYIQVGKTKRAALTFNNAELAEALEYSLVAVYRMQTDGRLPKAVIKTVYKEGATNSNTGKFASEFVYTKPEVVAIMNALGQHQERVLHYRVTHLETTKAIFAAVNAVRKGK